MSHHRAQNLKTENENKESLFPLLIEGKQEFSPRFSLIRNAKSKFSEGSSSQAGYHTIKYLQNIC